MMMNRLSGILRGVIPPATRMFSGPEKGPGEDLRPQSLLNIEKMFDLARKGEPIRDKNFDYSKVKNPYALSPNKTVDAFPEAFASGKAVLVVGPGLSMILRRAKENGCTVNAVDISDKVCQFHDEDGFVCKNIAAAEVSREYGENSQDTVACIEVLPYIDERSIVQSLRAMSVVLKPGGVLIIDNYGTTHPWGDQELEAWAPAMVRRDPEEVVRRLPTDMTVNRIICYLGDPADSSYVVYDEVGGWNHPRPPLDDHHGIVKFTVVATRKAVGES